jgi:two-component system, LytTR family, response regulator
VKTEFEKTGSARLGQASQHSRSPLVIVCGTGEQTTTSMESLPAFRELTKTQPHRLAIKVKDKILFISLSDIVSVQAEGNYVSFQRNDSSYLLRGSISALSTKLETYGFIRIHRSVLVNTSFVREIRRLSTGECCLRIDGGKEYAVTRTYKRNLKSLAEFWIGTGAFFPS